MNCKPNFAIFAFSNAARLYRFLFLDECNETSRDNISKPLLCFFVENLGKVLCFLFSKLISKLFSQKKKHFNYKKRASCHRSHQSISEKWMEVAAMNSGIYMYQNK